MAPSSLAFLPAPSCSGRPGACQACRAGRSKETWYRAFVKPAQNSRHKSNRHSVL